MPSDQPATAATSSYGRVRPRMDGIGVTFAGIEHVLTPEEACGLVNAVAYTLVDGKERNFQTCSRENSDGI